MAAPTILPTIDTQINFFQPPADGSRAYVLRNAPADGGPRRNYSDLPHNVEVENIRGQEQAYKLDVHGFQFGVHATKLQDFNDKEAVSRDYYAESAEVIKNATGASRVVVFDHTIRRRTGEADTSPEKRQPAAVAHVDQTPKASRARVFLHLPAEEASKLVEKRYQIINLWRPIENPAFDWPLALADYRTVNPEKDVQPVALMYDDREGETYGVSYNPALKWKYLKGIRPEEYILIKCFDSIQDGSVAKFTPHTAVFDPTTPEDAPARQSIELRALVFYD